MDGCYIYIYSIYLSYRTCFGQAISQSSSKLSSDWLLPSFVPFSLFNENITDCI